MVIKEYEFQEEMAFLATFEHDALVKTSGI